MTRLSEWFDRYQRRPLRLSAVCLLAIWVSFSTYQLHSTELKQRFATQQSANFLSLPLDTKDRSMIESLLEALVSQSGASSAAICDSKIQLIATNLKYSSCSDESTSWVKAYRFAIPGSSRLELVTRFDRVRMITPILVVLCIGLILTLLAYYFIRSAQRRIEQAVFLPLQEKLFTKESLEIYELNEIRDKFHEAQKAEAQTAVALAIQAKNLQVAHDIRSPLSALNMLASAMDANDPKTELLKTVSKRIGRIAEELLSNARHSSISSFSICAVLKTVVDEKQLLLGDQASIIIQESLEKVDFSVVGNSDAFTRIVSNLIDNSADASSPSRPLTIEISLSSTETAVELTIKDNGQGIPPDLIDKVGQLNFSHGPKRMKSSGNGLGVYGARELLKSWNGSLSISSVFGESTTVKVCLIRAQPIAPTTHSNASL